MKKLSVYKQEIINGLIPEARREADNYIKKHGKSAPLTWSTVYHRAMDRLAKEAGVRV